MTLITREDALEGYEIGAPMEALMDYRSDSDKPTVEEISLASLTPEDRKFARRIGRIILLAYSSIALALTASIIAHIALKNSTTAKPPIEVATKPDALIHPLSLR